MRKSIYVILAFIIIGSCTDNSSHSNGEVRSVGRYKNGKEVGSWVYENDKGSKIEEGSFDDGIRVGIWRYYWPIKDSILWSRFSNSSGTIITNFPSFLVVKDNYDSLVYSEYSDTNKIFKLAIGVEGCADIVTLDQYSDLLFKDLKNKKFEIYKTKSERILTQSGRNYMYHKITGKRSDLKEVVIYNITEIRNNRIFDISVWAEVELAERCNKTFFSIISNIYFDSTRFINPKDLISTIK